MIKAVLLDLDQTLLENPIDRFVKGYLKKLAAHLIVHFPNLDPLKLREAMLVASQQTITNLDPTLTNRDVFFAAFSHIAGLDAAAMPAIMERFIQESYPTLQSLTRSVPAALPLVNWLFEHGYAVAVATNPLFLSEMVAFRLAWAGLAEQPFWFISTMDNVHFTKPSPHYYEEILTRIGVEPDEALMVGDDWANDIIPAHAAGLNTFWVQVEDVAPPESESSNTPDGQGTLAAFLHLVRDSQWLATLEPRPLHAAQIGPRLVGNVAALIGMASEIPDHFWHQRPDPSEWSPLEIVVHLHDSEVKTQRARLQRILDEDNPFLEPPPPPPAPGKRALGEVDGLETVYAFANERSRTLELLEALPQEAWTRTARHSVFGPTNLLEMAAFTARHDRLHINQLCQTVGKCE
ncbi:MAG: HAD-IA family hydrolase [Chloroflexi bacterium]|nr:HAD-IA family hydrolase [Chloroflexota bacterium]